MNISYFNTYIVASNEHIVVYTYIVASNEHIVV